MAGNEGLFFPSAGKGVTLESPLGGATTGGYTSTASGTVPTAKGKKVPSSSQSIDRPDYNTTQVITNTVYQSLMGRDATQAEIQKAHEAYTQYALTHPTSYSSGTVDSLTNQTNRTDTSTGVSESSFIQNLINGSAESKAYTSATTYMDAIQSYINKSRGLY